MTKPTPQNEFFREDQPEIDLQSKTEKTGDNYDPLLSCLEYIATSIPQPFSRSGAVIGLPLKNGCLSIDLLSRAATRMGLSARVVKRKVVRAPTIVVPFIVLFDNGDAAVVVEKDVRNKSFKVVFPANSNEIREVSYKWLAGKSSGHLVYISAASSGVSKPDASTKTTATGHWFWATVLQYWPSWLQIIIAALLVNLLGLATPLFVMSVYDRVIPNLAIPTLWALAAGVTIALGFDFILKFVRALVLDSTGRRVDMKVASNLFEHALGISMKDRQTTAGATANQIREFETVRDFFTSSSIIATTDLVFIGIFIFVMWLIVGPIAFVPLFAVPIVLLSAILIQIPLARSVSRTQMQTSRRQSILVESLIGIESIKAASSEGVMQKKWEDAIAATARANSSTRLWSSLALYFTGSVQQGVGVVVIVWGVFLVASGDITVGGLIASNILAGRVLAPLGNIAMTITRAQQAFGAMRDLGSFMSLPSERRSTVATGKRVQSGKVEFRNASFSYSNAPSSALSNISIVIQPGERVGIIGRVGSGKTTMAKLMAGFYEVDEGFVLVGDVDTRAYEISDLRQAVCLVTQEPELFSGTLRENILMAKPTASEEEISEVTRIAGVDNFAAAHPLGLAMSIGERGRGLSGGQRQAVALARILLKDSCKVLFLDEPSSAMDTTSETQLVNNLDGWLGKDRTLIVCTHRGSFLNLVDRLIIIDAGQVVADGPKNDVLKELQSRASRGGKAGKAKTPPPQTTDNGEVKR